MKFNKLIIKNIASIADATIDFDNSALSNCGIFLISGKTGSGKSTILDAICLALYCKTPRLDKSSMQGNIADNTQEINVRSPRQLLKRGTADGFVELTFVGNNGLSYIARWGIARTKKNPEGNLKQRTWSITETETNHSFNKDEDVKRVIYEAVGLDFDQFCRTTMLAQGDFSRFLNSTDKEKADILEKITGTDIYSRIGAQIFQIIADRERTYKEKLIEIGTVKLLNDNEIASIKEEINQLTQEQTSLNSEINLQSFKAEWLRTLISLYHNVETTKQTLDDAQRLIDAEEFKQKVNTSNDWDASHQARGLLDSFYETQSRLKKTETQLISKKKIFEDIINGILFEQIHLQDLTNELSQIKSSLKEMEIHKNSYEKTDLICAYLEQLIIARKNIKSTQGSLISQNHLLENTLRKSSKEAKKHINQLEDTLRKCESLIHETSDKLTRFNISLLRKKKSEKDDKIISLRLVQLKIIEHERLISNIEQNSRYIDELNQRALQNNDIILTLTKEKEDAQRHMDNAKVVYESQKDSVDKFARLMRSRLHKGDNCPVCRQTITSDIISEKELNDLITSYEKSYNEQRNTFLSVDEKLRKCELETASLNANIKNYEETVQKERINADLIRTEIAKSIEDCGITLQENNQKAEIEKIIANEISESQTLLNMVGEAEKLEEDLMMLRSKKDNLLSKISLANENLQKNESKIIESEKQILLFEEKIRTWEEQIDGLTKELESIIDQSWNHDWLNDPAGFSSLLSSEAKKFEELKSLKIEIENTISKTEFSLQPLEKLNFDIIRLMPHWADLKPTLPCKVENIAKIANQLFIDISNLKTTITNYIESIDDSTTKINEFLIENPDFSHERLNELRLIEKSTIENLKKEIAEANDRLRDSRAKSEVALEQVAQHQKNRPDLHDDDTLEKLTLKLDETKKLLDEKSETIGRLKNVLTSDNKSRTEVGQLNEQANQRLSELNKWKRLDKLASADGSAFKKIAQSYILGNLINAANHYLKTLSGRYTLKNRPGNFVIVVEDAYQGYAERAASTLSGGETFLVSLSLALALSDMGGRLGVDMLFIDEGFGTLSGEHLQKAVSTLRSLHSNTGKRVGIISHVEELRERIPVQIRIEQDGNSSTSRVIMP